MSAQFCQGGCGMSIIGVSKELKNVESRAGPGQVKGWDENVSSAFPLSYFLRLVQEEMTK